MRLNVFCVGGFNGDIRIISQISAVDPVFCGLGVEQLLKKAMKRKDKFEDDYDDGKIGIDDYVDFKCGEAFWEVIAIIIAILLIVILP